MNSEKLLETVIRAADNKKAQDIVALDVHEVSGIADSFVIMEAMNVRQIDAVVDAILDAVRLAGFPNADGAHQEGQASSGWVLLDLGNVVVSVFDHETRARFNLEKLWLDAPVIELKDWLS